ncbi:PilC/PilY family type IV pilus protein [Craterilacuibacter sp. RT1T]|uniref:pilus assembly protein n=1 Tax=Craterilacuibacter sp. RT1T TaxID=2942211 RepID=UPI0020C05732|nr:PilC/PilY family type IV pilus protein [Craterilacuibacter sp. RT1T]MCL6264286.1 PilC/PilY family type IV pilus protein [Craterilacuibacter sp. RT1T]
MLKPTVLPVLLALALLPASHATELADVPLYLAIDMAPNVILTLDDSGSMTRTYAPDSLNSNNTQNQKRYKAATYNGIAYNPKLVYPIPQVRGRNYTTRFDKAPHNGFNPGQGDVNLASSYLTYRDCNFSGSRPDCSNPDSKKAAPAFYSLWYADAGLNRPSSCNTTTKSDACYVEVTVGSPSDIFAGNSAAQKQNFANWYSFYRTRAQAMISGAMQAIEGVDDGRIRLGWQALTACKEFNGRCQGYDKKNRENRIRTLDDNHREGLYSWLERFNVYGWTPLRSALQRAGEYLKTDEPWQATPGSSQGTAYSCRKSFHVMFTDGLWNQDSGFNAGGNVDGSSRSLPDGKNYAPRAPFNDNNHNSLADAAFKYWSEDLRNDLPNKVPASFSDRSGDATAQYWNPKNNPATWQHMVTFGIGLGLGETLVAPNPVWAGGTWQGQSYADLATGKASWPAVNASGSNETVGHVYDLWHAALNSRGQFFSADDPQALADAFKQTFASIIDASPTAAPLVANTGAIQQGSLLYQAGFDSKDWHGQLQAWQINSNGSLGAVKWDAAKLIPTPAARKLFTLNGSSARAFDSCSQLSNAQLGALGPDLAGCNQRLQWLRGDNRQEVRNGGTLRNRPLSVLGDIINSAPVHASGQDFGWSQASGASERSSYAAYVASKRGRTPLLLAGANDGMLHGFHADTGQELFGFLPPAVFGKLKALTEPAYSHQYTVDGSPTLNDAYLNGQWKTVMVGGLNKGGKAVYALDVSNPAGFATQHVLWQFTDPDLGYSYGQPQIVRLPSGDWAAVFGSGYDAPRQALFVVKLDNGSLLQKIVLDQGQGLTHLTLHDQNKDGVTDSVYASDISGLLWKFDLSSTTAGAWKTANQGKPLFSSGGQPMTSEAVIGAHPQGRGVLIYFGTGRYLGPSDINNQTPQSFYAVWDKQNDSGTTLTSAQLLVQTLEAEITQGGDVLRKSSSHVPDWSFHHGWQLSMAGTGSKGERIVTRALLNENRVFFTSMIPSTDPCVPGGESWLMMLRADSGGRTVGSAVDLNGDGVIDNKDLLGGQSVSGIKLDVGIATAPTFVSNPNTPGLSPIYVSGTSGKNQQIDIGVPITKPEEIRLKRIYWKQIL